MVRALVEALGTPRNITQNVPAAPPPPPVEDVIMVGNLTAPAAMLLQTLATENVQGALDAKPVAELIGRGLLHKQNNMVTDAGVTWLVAHLDFDVSRLIGSATLRRPSDSGAIGWK